MIRNWLHMQLFDVLQQHRMVVAGEWEEYGQQRDDSHLLITCSVCQVTLEGVTFASAPAEIEEAWNHHLAGYLVRDLLDL